MKFVYFIGFFSHEMIDLIMIWKKFSKGEGEYFNEM